MTDPDAYAVPRSRLLEALRAQGIVDSAVLEAMESVPRERFVPHRSRERSYENAALRIESGQTISQPYIVGLMSQSLGLNEHCRVLEIGTGSGYQCAVLARLAGTVYTIERLEDLAESARRTLEEIGATNVEYRVGDGSLGWPEEAPFDRIIVTAATRRVPPPLWDQLAERGRIVLPLGGLDSQDLMAIDKVAGRPVDSFLCPCRFVPLLGEAAS